MWVDVFACMCVRARMSSCSGPTHSIAPGRPSDSAHRQQWKHQQMQAAGNAQEHIICTACAHLLWGQLVVLQELLHQLRLVLRGVELRLQGLHAFVGACRGGRVRQRRVRCPFGRVPMRRWACACTTWTDWRESASHAQRGMHVSMRVSHAQRGICVCHNARQPCAKGHMHVSRDPTGHFLFPATHSQAPAQAQPLPCPRIQCVFPFMHCPHAYTLPPVPRLEAAAC